MQGMDNRNTENDSRNEANETDRGTSGTSDANISIELVKETFIIMLREQEEKILDIVRNGISHTNACLDWLTQEISDNNIKINALSKDTNDLKPCLEHPKRSPKINLKK